MHTHVLTLREYEPAQIGQSWDPSNRIVPAHFVASLERLQADQRRDIFTISRHSIKAQQFVGTVGLNGLAIDILPKTDQAEDATRANLIRMLSVAGLVPEIESGIAKLLPAAPTLLDSFMSLYVRRLAFEWRRGRIMDYQRKAANRACLKGKLLFPLHLKHNVLHPERFFTRVDEFTEDVPVSRMLKAALHVCRRQSVNHEIRREAVELLADFEGVADTCFSVDDLDRTHVDRKALRFEPLANLARMFLSGQVPDRPGQGHTYSLVFDMNVVFERYIGRLLKDVVCPPRWAAHLQVSDRHLLLRGTKACFLLQPDVGVYEKGNLVCLLDTKWKRLDPNRPHNGVGQDDIYQMYAYAKEYRCSQVILLYPHAEGLGRQVASYRHFPGSVGCSRLDISTVNIGRAPYGYEADSVRQQLREILTASLGDTASRC